MGRPLELAKTDARTHCVSMGVVISDDITVEETVDLYLRSHADMKKAVRINAVSKHVPSDAEISAMTNDDKIAAINRFNNSVRACLSNLSHVDDKTSADMSSMLLTSTELS